MIHNYELDREARITGGGSKLIGGSPMRVVKLGPRGAEVVHDALSDVERHRTEQEQALLDGLVGQGLMHPMPSPSPGFGNQVSVVIPAFQEAENIGRLVASLDYVRQVIVVDDGSTDETADRAAAAGAKVISNPRSLGPAAARNVGFRSAESEFVAFLDADCEPPPPDWLDRLLPYIAGGQANLIAPRVTGGERAPGGSRWIEAYERENCPLDMGPHRSLVGTGRRVGYVPSAAMLVEVESLERVGGFDESLRFGEDVDLVWRLGQKGEVCRYEPSVRIHHRPRSSPAGFVSQHFSYGGSAVALEARNPGKLAPVSGAPRSLVAAFAMPLLGPLPLAGSAAWTARKLRRAGLPLGVREAFAIGMAGELSVAGATVRAVSREWLVPFVLLAFLSRRWSLLARVLVATIFIGDGRSYRGRSLIAVPLMGLVARLAYSLGLWLHALKSGSFGSTLPDARSRRRG